MSARDVIAKLISGAPFPSKKTFNRVDDALDALADAGYRILAPGALDRETLEAAVKHLEGLPSFGDGKWAARAIRELGGGEG